MAQRDVEQYLRPVARPERGWIVQLQDAQSGLRFWASILHVDVEAETMLVVVESDTGADNLGYGAGDAFTVAFRYVHHIGPPASRAQLAAEVIAARADGARRARGRRRTSRDERQDVGVQENVEKIDAPPVELSTNCEFQSARRGVFGVDALGETLLCF